MGGCMKLFTIAELDALDEEQLEILRTRAWSAIENEINTNQQLRDILERLVRPLYTELTPRRRGQRARRAARQP